jgi:hypothetical protein
MFREAIITHPVVVNDGKPFDALTATLQFDYQNCGTVSILYYRDGVQIEEPLIEGLDTVAGDLFVNLIKWQLAQAVNPPIKVTQAVLKAMDRNRGGKYLHVQESMHGIQTTELFCLESMVETYAFRPLLNCSQITLKIGHYIQADCPLALQVLLGFTVEGVPVND